MMHPRTPAQVADYVEALGLDGEVTFLLAFGGAELYIPADPKGSSRLVEVMGMDAAQSLAALAQRKILQRRVPTAKPWLARVMLTKGLSKAEIARTLHASDVAVRRWIAGHRGEGAVEAPGDPDQLNLF